MSTLVLSQTANRGPGSITFELSVNKITFTFSEVKKFSGLYILEFRLESGFSDNPKTRKIVLDLLQAKKLDCESARNSFQLNVEEKIEAVFGLEILSSQPFSDICIKSEKNTGEIDQALNPNLYLALKEILSSK
jgi:hypothetical protein